MNSLSQLFWAAQQVYLMKVFLLIILCVIVLLIGLIAVFAVRFYYQHYRLWHLGKEEDCSGKRGERIKTLCGVVFANFKIGKELFPGAMHLLMLWGAILLFLGKIVRLFSYPVGVTNPPQTIFLCASFVSEVGGILILIGGLMAIFRRYILKPSRLETKPDRTLIYLWGIPLLLTGYLIKGFRMAAVGIAVPPDWYSWAPISGLISKAVLILPTQPLNELLVWHRVLIHAIPAFLLLAYVAVSHSPLQHLFLSPINIFYRPFRHRGVVEPIPNFEEADTFGVTNISEFTWKQLLDLEACTNCGRCQDACPAHLTGKPLSPRRMTQNLKEHLWREGPKLLATPVEKREPEAVMQTTVGEDELWACTACMACEEACPVYIEQIRRNVDMRRYLVLMETKFHTDVKLAFKNMQTNGNPWGVSRGARAEWAKSLGVKKYAEVENPEILFWVGCAGSYDDRNQKVATSLVKILKATGIRFGFLGTEEGCCGDSARRMGNEYLFQTLAEAAIETLKTYGVKKILTMCPHCFHTMKNEYPQLGGEFEVIHYTQFLTELISSGKLKLTRPISKVITYHDSCYLGRGNQLYDVPRKILQSIPGVKLVEMERNQSRSFCCGAGGGRMWMEEKIGTRINQKRTDHAAETQAEMIGTACPYCLSMLVDGVKETNRSEKMTVSDLGELVEQSMELPPAAASDLPANTK
jgi:Fe-S oxidoreductase